MVQMLTVVRQGSGNIVIKAVDGKPWPVAVDGAKDKKVKQREQDPDIVPTRTSRAVVREAVK